MPLQNSPPWCLGLVSGFQGVAKVFQSLQAPFIKHKAIVSNLGICFFRVCFLCLTQWLLTIDDGEFICAALACFTHDGQISDVQFDKKALIHCDVPRAAQVCRISLRIVLGAYLTFTSEQLPRRPTARVWTESECYCLNNNAQKKFIRPCNL